MTGTALLIAPPGSYRIAAYVGAARRLGLRLFVVSEGDSLLPAAGGLRVPLQPHDDAVEVILAASRENSGFVAVVASDDATVELAGRVACALGLAGNPPDAAKLSRRKDLARGRLAAAKVKIPDYRIFDLRSREGVAGLPYPRVVKPIAMSGSRGVIRVDDEAQYLAALDRVAAILSDAPTEEERYRLVVEAFVPGPEVALEGILYDGRLEPLALFDKPDPLDGPYFEETIYVTPSRLDAAAQARIIERTQDAVTAYGLTTGPVHAELRWHEGDAWMLEVAARTIGGECAKLLRFDGGHGLEELVLSSAMGRPLGKRLTSGAAGVMMLPTRRAGTLRRVEGLLEARDVPGVQDISIAVGTGAELTPLPEGAAYLGYIFARGDDPGDVERALREAAARLQVVIAPMWRLHPAA